MMSLTTLNDVAWHCHGRAGLDSLIVCLNALRTDLRIWNEVIAQLSDGAPSVCMGSRSLENIDAFNTQKQPSMCYLVS